MANRIMVRPVQLLLPLIILIVGGCAPATPSLVAPTASPQPTQTTEPTSTIAPIPTPTFPEALVSQSLLLTFGTTSDCQRPCWHGLRIGSSSREEVQDVFTSLMNPLPGYDFFSPSVQENSPGDLRSVIPGIYIGGQTWYVEKTPPDGPLGIYGLYAIMDKNTDRLLGIIESMGAFGQYDVPTLPELMTRLGMPDWIYGGVSVNTYDVALFYKDGIKVHLSIELARTPQSDSVCLDSKPVLVTSTLVDPYVSLNEADLSPLQQEWAGPRDPAPYIAPGLGESIDQYIELVTGDNPCFQTSP